MRTLVVLTVIAIAMLVAVFSRYAALLLYWWFAIFRPQDWIWTDVSHLRLSFVAGLLLAIPCVLTGRLPRIDHVIPILMLIWLVLEAWATYSAGCGELGTKWLTHLAKLVLVLLLTNRLLTSPRRVFWLTTVVALSVAFFSARQGFFAFVRGGVVQYDIHHFAGTLSGSNAAACGIALTIFLLIATAQNATNPEVHPTNAAGTEPRRWQQVMRMGLWLAVPFSAYQVISLFSRGSALGLAVGLLVWLLLRERPLAAIAALIPLALVVLLLVPIPEGYMDRFSSIFAGAEERDKSASSRPHFWGVAAAIAADYPMGVGAACYPRYYDLYDPTGGEHGQERSVHSSHFQILAETGYLGVVVWALLFFTALKSLLDVRRVSLSETLSTSLSRFLFTFSNALIGLIVTYAVASSFYELAYSEFIWLAFLLAVVLVRFAQESSEDVSPPPSRSQSPEKVAAVRWWRGGDRQSDGVSPSRHATKHVHPG